MMLLQADAIQVGSGVISLTTLMLVLRLSYNAGGLVRQVEVNTRRIDELESRKCPHPECPLLRSIVHQHQQQFESEPEG